MSRALTEQARQEHVDALKRDLNKAWAALVQAEERNAKLEAELLAIAADPARAFSIIERGVLFPEENP